MTLYLIAHKVRGEPAFDVALKMPMADGDWWIIPTSGHRAYPFWTWPLAARFNVKDLGDLTGPMPADLRDHYAITTEPPRSGRSEVQTRVPTLEDI